MPKILVVDDEPDIADYIASFFRDKVKFDVLTTTSGRGALALVERERPDAVLLDIRMKDISGLDVLKAVKGRFPGTYVIMLTAQDDTDTMNQARQLGANDFIAKPISLRAIEKNKWVRELMEHKRPLSERTTPDAQQLKQTIVDRINRPFQQNP